MLSLRNNFSFDLQYVVIGTVDEDSCSRPGKINFIRDNVQASGNDFTVSFPPVCTDWKSVAASMVEAGQHISYRIIETCESFHPFFVSINSRLFRLKKIVSKSVKQAFIRIVHTLLKIYQHLNILRL